MRQDEVLHCCRGFVVSYLITFILRTHTISMYVIIKIILLLEIHNKFQVASTRHFDVMLRRFQIILYRVSAQVASRWRLSF